MTSRPTQMPAQALALASSSATGGGHGDSSQAGKQMVVKSAGPKQSDLNSSSERFALLHADHISNILRSSVITEELSRAGGKAVAEINPQMKSFAEFMSSRRHERITVHSRYVASKLNPADDPSRGIYPPLTFLLPSIQIPIELQPFLIDFDAEPQLSEQQA
jgi:hypothetical protein